MRRPFWFPIAFTATVMALGLGGPARAQMLGNGQYGPLPGTAPIPESNGLGPGPGTTQNGGTGAAAGMTGPASAPTNNGGANNGGYGPNLGNFSPSLGNFGPGANGYAPSLGNFGPSGTGTQQ